MRFARLVFFIIMLSLLELFFVPLPVVFITLFLFFHFYDEEHGLVLAFVVGFLFDILLLRPLGTTAMLFMILLFITSLYRRKYEATNIFFLGMMIFVSILVLEFTLTKTIAIQIGLFGMVVTMIIGRFFVPTTQKYESWYR